MLFLVIIVFCFGCSALVKRLAGKIMSEMICNVSGGTLNHTHVNAVRLRNCSQLSYKCHVAVYFSSAVQSSDVIGGCCNTNTLWIENSAQPRITLGK